MRSKYGQVDPKDPYVVYRPQHRKQVEVVALKWSDLISNNRIKLTYLSNHLATKDREVQEYWQAEFGEVPTKELFSKMQSADELPKKKRK